MQEKNDIDVYICGLLDGEEEIVTQTTGIMQVMDGKTHIFFYERFDGDVEETRNHIVIDGAQVRVMKRGPVEVNMIFEKELTHNTVYHTQTGILPIGVHTSHMEVKPVEEGLDLDILYTLEFEGAQPVENRLKMHIRNKNNDYLIT
jgi:uncharacterized beta-barrel protein YwiB (DUF1934 family)